MGVKSIELYFRVASHTLSFFFELSRSLRKHHTVQPGKLMFLVPSLFYVTFKILDSQRLFFYKLNFSPAHGEVDTSTLHTT